MDTFTTTVKIFFNLNLKSFQKNRIMGAFLEAFKYFWMEYNLNPINSINIIVICVPNVTLVYNNKRRFSKRRFLRFYIVGAPRLGEKLGWVPPNQNIGQNHWIQPKTEYPKPKIMFWVLLQPRVKIISRSKKTCKCKLKKTKKFVEYLIRFSINEPPGTFKR